MRKPSDARGDPVRPHGAAPDLVGPAAGAVERPVATVTTAPTGLEGEGFPVRRAFAGLSIRALDPFVHMDQMGEVEYAPGEPKGTPWHPHRGFETVTYMIDGTFAHQDSQGGGGLITDGATQWMTAGGGILHIETPPEELVVAGGLFHGIQLWVNLPARDKMIPPAYQALEADDVVLVATGDGGAVVRIIAGEVAGRHGPGSTHTPMALTHASVAPGALLELPWDRDSTRSSTCWPDRDRRHRPSAGPGRPAGVVRPRRLDLVPGRRRAGLPSAGLEVLVLGGRPIGEPVEHYGPFVMNTRDEIVQALEDFEAGRLGTVPPDALMPHTPDPDPVRAEHTGI